MRNANYFLIISLIIISQSLLAKSIDSLKMQLQSLELSSKAYVGTHVDIATYFRKKRTYDSALVYAEEAVKLARNSQYDSLEAEALHILGRIYCKKEIYGKGKEYFFKAIKVANDHNYPESVVRFAFNISMNVYRPQNQYDSSFYYFHKALLVGKKAELNFRNAWIASQMTLDFYRLGVSDSTEKYAKATEEFIREIHKPEELKGVVNVYMNLGKIYRMSGDLDKQISYLRKGFAITQTLKFTKSSLLNELGLLYAKKGILDSAIWVYEQAYFQNTQNNDTIDMSRNLNNMGNIYKDFKLYPEALSRYQNAVLLKQKIQDTLGLGIVYNNIGHTYQAMERYDSALFYYQEALEMKKKFQKGLSYAITLNNLGNIYNALKNEALAEQYYSHSLEITHKMKAQPLLVQNLNGLASLHYYQKKYQKALPLLEEAFQKAKEMDEKQALMDSYTYLSKCYEALGNYKKAHEYQILLKETSDLIFNQQQSKIILQLQAKYETDKKDQEIASLKATEILQQEKLIAEQKQKMYFIVFSILSLLSFLTIAVLFFRVKRSNQQLSKQKIEIEQLSQTKNHLFAIIAHDLRGPLSSFQSTSKLIQFYTKKQAYDKLNALGENIQHSIVQLNNLLDNLLNWSITQMGSFSYQQEAIALQEVFQQQKEIFSPMALSKEIDLQFSCDENLQVFADNNSLQTIFRNLISNALKFTPKGGNIEISAHQHPNGQIKVEVKDGGIGMDETSLEELFLLKAGKSQQGTQNEKGTGLGLVLVKEFVTANQGSIQVKSSLGEGTTFALSLPKAV